MSETAVIAAQQVMDPPSAVTVEVIVRLRAIATPETDGRYSVRVPALPGCYTEGDSIDEVRANVVDAAEGWLAVKHDMEIERRP